MITKDFTITSEVGLHARPATLLVQEASRYSSEIELHYSSKKVNVKSIMGIMSLGLSKGKQFEITINGHDEEEALEGIKALFSKEGIAE
jgi:phosphocarrier protein